MKTQYEKVSDKLSYNKKDVKEKVEGVIGDKGKLLEINVECKKVRSSRLKLKCNKGHIWESSYDSIVNHKSWCPTCSKENKKYNKKITIEDCKELEKRVKYKLISKKCDGARDYIKWKCPDCGKPFKKMYYQIRDGKGCPKCVVNKGNSKHSLKDIQKYVKEHHQGECLSEEYSSITSPLLFRCKKGHEFETIWGSVLRGHWCKKCSDKIGFNKQRKDRIKDAIAFGKENNLEFLYLNKGIDNTNKKIRGKKPYYWKCLRCGEIFKQNIVYFKYSLKNNKYKHSLCPSCFKSEYDYEYCCKLAKERDGEFRSKIKIVKSKKYYTWYCNKCEKEWKTTFDSIKTKDSWCPNCSCKTENKVRDLFKKVLKKDFIKCRPKWLRNPETNHPLELDGYCKDLKTAFEYQGYQHYVLSHFNNYSEIALKKQKQIDRYKKKVCEEKGINLITIKYDRSLEIIEKYLMKHKTQLSKIR